MFWPWVLIKCIRSKTRFKRENRAVFAGPAGREGPGYRVRETPQPEAVAVHEPDGEALRACAATLEGAGWQVSEHREPRDGTRYLLASPRRT